MRQLVGFGLNDDGGTVLLEVHEAASVTGPVSRDLCGARWPNKPGKPFQTPCNVEPARSRRPGGGLARSHLTAAAGIEPVVASAAGIALAGLAFYPRSVR
jgi:hypothetical protein